MLEEIWNNLIAFTEQFVVPDWDALIALIPFGLALLVALYLAWIGYRFATAGPTRRGKHRLAPVPPGHIHMPGPSFAPFLGAIGLFFMVMGMVVGGLWLLIGVVILGITLLYWGREELRDFDRSTATAGAVPVTGLLPAPEGPVPAGIHMPPPSFRPVLVALGMTLLVGGLVVGGWLLIAGTIALVITLLGWLWDARKEYTEVEAADRTGHLDSGGAPAWPKAVFATLAVLVVVGVVLGSGIIGQAADDELSAGEPPASGAPAAGGGEAPPPSQGPDADVVVTAKGTQWVEKELTAPADAPFTMALDNQDNGMPHDVVIKDAAGTEAFKTDIVTGPAVKVYDVPALAAGQYSFVCSIHPNMTGTLSAS